MTGNIIRFQIVDDWYHLEHRTVSKRSTEPHIGVHSRLMGDIRVRRAEQQQAKSRTKRDLVVKRGSAVLQTILNDERWPSMWYLVSTMDLHIRAIPTLKLSTDLE